MKLKKRVMNGQIKHFKNMKNKIGGHGQIGQDLQMGQERYNDCTGNQDLINNKNIVEKQMTMNSFTEEMKNIDYISKSKIDILSTYNNYNSNNSN